jgi:hypothetical protein
LPLGGKSGHATPAGALPQAMAFPPDRVRKSESQCAAVAAKLANMKHGGDRKSDQEANLPLENNRVTQAQAADMLNVPQRPVKSAKRVIDQGAPELIAAVE